MSRRTRPKRPASARPGPGLVGAGRELELLAVTLRSSPCPNQVSDRRVGDDTPPSLRFSSAAAADVAPAETTNAAGRGTIWLGVGYCRYSPGSVLMQPRPALPRFAGADKGSARMGYDPDEPGTAGAVTEGVPYRQAVTPPTQKSSYQALVEATACCTCYHQLHVPRARPCSPRSNPVAAATSRDLLVLRAERPTGGNR
eukprot:scaffold1085_cov407-Prasinococcus_capsulatus_cf.AAC.24